MLSSARAKWRQTGKPAAGPHAAAANAPPHVADRCCSRERSWLQFDSCVVEHVGNFRVGRGQGLPSPAAAVYTSTVEMMPYAD